MLSTATWEATFLDFPADSIMDVACNATWGKKQTAMARLSRTLEAKAIGKRATSRRAPTRPAGQTTAGNRSWESASCLGRSRNRPEASRRERRKS